MVLPPYRASADQDPTVVLSPQSAVPGPAADDATVPLTGPQAQARQAAAPQTQPIQATRPLSAPRPAAAKTSYQAQAGPNRQAQAPLRPAPAAGFQAGYPGQPGPYRGENSPSGRLHMLAPSHIRQTRPSLWILLQHFFSAGVLFALLYSTLSFFLTTERGQRLDEVAFQEFSYQFLTYTEQTSQLLDLVPATGALAAGIGLVFILVWKHRFVPALVGLAMAVGANVSTQLLKNFFLVKPNLGIQEALGNSAPSGHTTFAAAAGLALFLASPKRFRPSVAFFGMLIAMAAGYSTIINGWHRPADVVSAILLTGLWGILGLVILRFLRSEELDMNSTQRSGLILVPLLSITSFFVGFCALALYWITDTNPIPGSASVAAICLIIATATFTTSVLIALLRPQNKQRSAYRKVWAY